MPNRFSKGEKIYATKIDKAKRLSKISLYVFIFIFICFLFFTSKVLVSDKGSGSFSWLDKIPLISNFKHLVESSDKKLKGEDRDRINILLLGVGGDKHEGGHLTDTIIFLSLEPSTKKVAFVSLPRDLVVPIENMGWRKINSVNAYAEFEKKDSGGLAASQAVSDLISQPVDYYVRIDFEGFVNIIDRLGGVNVYVENTLSDWRYPVSGREKAEPYESRFEHLYIEKGSKRLDGSLALKYARSRHAAGVEGSDFARAKRQQKVLEAAKNEMLKKKNLLNPAVLAGVISDLRTNISTNLKIWEIIKLWDLFNDLNREAITNKVLDNSPNSLLMERITETGTYTLEPRSGDFAEIQYFFQNIFLEAHQETKSFIYEEKGAVEIRNGTWINGLASKAALDLEKMGFRVVRIGNSSRQNFQRSVIYDLTYGEKEKSLAILKEHADANIAFGLPQWLIDDIKKDLDGEKTPEQPDFILILGQNADETQSGKENIYNGQKTN